MANTFRKIYKRTGSSGTAADYQLVGNIGVDGVELDIMKGASSSTDGELGLVPKPTKEKYKFFLRASGIWAILYTHPSYTAKSSGLYKVTVDSTGHVRATSAVTKSDITALGIPGQDTNTTYTLGSFGITATATQLNYVKGVTSSIQT